MHKKVFINEIGPRDGFQSVHDFIPTEIKRETIDRIAAAGVSKIQVTSFVSPKAVPQMSDAMEIAKYAVEKYSNLYIYALVPNVFGAQRALECGIKNISFVTSVSQSHNMANVKRTINESFDELEKIVTTLPDLNVTLDCAVAFGCPFEGAIPYNMVSDYIKRGASLGIKKFNLCDTIGIATPDLIDSYLNNILNDFSHYEFSVHIHDTRNMGIINSLTAVKCGIKNIDVAIGGLGGCPFAPGASGNTSSEDFVYMLNNMGYETGIDSQKLIDAAKFVKDNVNGKFSGHHIFIGNDFKNQC